MAAAGEGLVAGFEVGIGAHVTSIECNPRPLVRGCVRGGDRGQFLVGPVKDQHRAAIQVATSRDRAVERPDQRSPEARARSQTPRPVRQTYKPEKPDTQEARHPRKPV